MKFVIFDIDDTLSDTTHRRHFVERVKGNDWTSFFLSCGKDSEKEEIVRLARKLAANGLGIAIMSGRRQSVRDISVDWLEKAGINADRMFFRREKDFRKSHVVKQSWTEVLLSEGHEIVMALDDEEPNRRMFSGLGITALDPDDHACVENAMAIMSGHVAPKLKKSVM